nr:hypothetical protein [Tanacetum cinerariifolium]
MLKGTYFGAKMKAFEDCSFLTNTPYPGKEIRRISAKSSQENAYSQFLIRRIHLLPYVVSMKITVQRYKDIYILGIYIVLIVNFAHTPKDTPQYAVLAKPNTAYRAFFREDDDLDDITDIFKIEGNMFDFETPLCEAFNDFNYLFKIDNDLFTFDIQGTGTHEEYELNNPVTRDLEEPCSDIGEFCNGGELPGMVRVGSMTYFQDHKWYDELADGRLKEETLMHKAKVEESWGNATPGVIKFCAWLINSFGNFYELDYNRPYANIKTKRAHDPYLEVNNIFGRIYDTRNAQDNQGHAERRDDLTLEPSVCKIRRFKMMKYSFNADKEYIAIKESEYLNHSKDSLDAYREILRIIDEGWVVTTPDEE